MKFKITRDVENRVFSTKIEFDGFGNESTLPEKEVEMFKDFGFPKIDIGGNFTALDDTFVTPSKEVEVKEGFLVNYAVSLEKVTGATEAEKIAKAKARVAAFETAIKERLDAAIEDIQPLADDFIEGNPELFEV